jgi:hypothetical protein
MTRSGTAYPLAPSAPPIAETGSGSSPTQPQLWPTPKSSPSGPDYARARRPRSGSDDLATAVARLVPTPTVSDSKGASPGLKREGSDNLAEFVMFLTPTASNRDSAGGTNSRRRQDRDGTYISGQLNPTWVEWLMGFPLGWTDLGVSATRSSRRSPSGSAGGS